MFQDVNVDVYDLVLGCIMDSVACFKLVSHGFSFSGLDVFRNLNSIF